MINTVNLFELAQLAEASYVLFTKLENYQDQLQIEDALKTKAFSGEFSSTQASEFIKNWRVVTQQPDTACSFSGTLFQYIGNDPHSGFQNGQYVYALKGTLETGDFATDVGDIATDGLALDQIVDMYNNWKHLNAEAGQPYLAAKLVTINALTDELQQSVTAWTTYTNNPLINPMPTILSPDALIASWSNRTDIVIDKPSNTVRTIEFGFSNLVFTDARQWGLGLASDIQAHGLVAVTGHSLGGHLADAFTRLFSSSGVSAVTINGAGYPTGSVQGLGLSSDFNISNLFSMLGGATQFETSSLNNIYGDRMPEFVTMNSQYGLAQQGASNALFIEQPTPWGNLAGHGAVQMTDSLAVYNLFIRLDSTLASKSPTEALAALKPLFEKSSNQVNRSLESLVVNLSQIILGNTPSIATDNREALYEAIKSLTDSATFQALAGKVTFSMEIPSLTEARTDLGVFLSLYYLMPFTLKTNDTETLNTIYTANQEIAAQWSVDRNLTANQLNQGLGSFSDKWLEDRINMLSWKLKINLDDAQASDVNPYLPLNNYLMVDPNTPAVKFQDPVSPFTIGETLGSRKLISFGSKESDKLEGGKSSDHVYGGGGIDKINGAAGNDYIEGNAGNDILNGDEGSDTLVGGIDNDTLTGGERSSGILTTLSKLLPASLGGYTSTTSEFDTLNGGDGFDTYVARIGDVIIDSDAIGSIYIADLEGNNPITLTGGVWDDVRQGFFNNQHNLLYKINQTSNQIEVFKLSNTSQGVQHETLSSVVTIKLSATAIQSIMTDMSSFPMGMVFAKDGNLFDISDVSATSTIKLDKVGSNLVATITDPTNTDTSSNSFTRTFYNWQQRSNLVSLKLPSTNGVDHLLSPAQVQDSFKAIITLYSDPSKQVDFSTTSTAQTRDPVYSSLLNEAMSKNAIINTIEQTFQDNPNYASDYTVPETTGWLTGTNIGNLNFKEYLAKITSAVSNNPEIANGFGLPYLAAQTAGGTQFYLYRYENGILPPNEPYPSGSYADTNPAYRAKTQWWEGNVLVWKNSSDPTKVYAKLVGARAGFNSDGHSYVFSSPDRPADVTQVVTGYVFDLVNQAGISTSDGFQIATAVANGSMTLSQLSELHPASKQVATPETTIFRNGQIVAEPVLIPVLNESERSAQFSASANPSDPFNTMQGLEWSYSGNEVGSKILDTSTSSAASQSLKLSGTVKDFNFKAQGGDLVIQSGWNADALIVKDWFNPIGSCTLSLISTINGLFSKDQVNALVTIKTKAATASSSTASLWAALDISQPAITSGVSTTSNLSVIPPNSSTTPASSATPLTVSTPVMPSPIKLGLATVTQMLDQAIASNSQAGIALLQTFNTEFKSFITALAPATSTTSSTTSQAAVIAENTLTSTEYGNFVSHFLSPTTASAFGLTIKTSPLSSTGMFQSLSLVNGSENNDYEGSNSADNIQGGSDTAVIKGNGGNDTIRTGYGTKVVDGGAGNDKIYRQDAVQATVLFGRGDGTDVVYSQRSDTTTAHDILRFKDGIRPEDVLVETLTSNNELGPNDTMWYGVKFVIKDTGDTLYVPDYYSSWLGNKAKFAKVEFSDGTVWTPDTMTILIQGRTPPVGTDPNSLSGFAYWLNAGNLIFDAGSSVTRGGNYLQGGAGDNVFMFDRGYGYASVYINPTSYGNNRSNTLVFKSDVSYSDVEAVRSGGDVSFRIKGSAGTFDQIDFGGLFYTASNALSGVAFNTEGLLSLKDFVFTADTTSSQWQTSGNYKIVNLTQTAFGSDFSYKVLGSSYDSTTTTGKGNDTFVAGVGSNTFTAGEGINVLEVSKTSGNQTFNTSHNLADTLNIIKFDASIVPADVSMLKVNGNLIISIAGGSSTITIPNITNWDTAVQSNRASSLLPEMAFANGTYWNVSDVLHEIADFKLGQGSVSIDTVTYLNQAIANYTAGSTTSLAHLKLGAGIDSSNLVFKKVYDNLVAVVVDPVTRQETSDSLTLTNYFSTVSGLNANLANTTSQPTLTNPLLSFNMMDGSTLDASQVEVRVGVLENGYAQWDGSVYFTSNYHLSNPLTVVGSAASGMYWLDESKVTIDSGSGDEFIMAPNAQNTLLFGHGDGNDRYSANFTDPSSRITIKFDSGITASDVSISQVDTYALKYTITNADGSTSSIKVDNYFNLPQIYSAKLTTLLSDGTVLDPSAMPVTLNIGENGWTYGGNLKYVYLNRSEAGLLTIVGSSDNAYVYGNSVNSNFISGSGNENVNLGIGHHTYTFGRGSGQDIFNLCHGDLSSTTNITLKFANSITATDLVTSRSGMDLVFEVSGSSDRLTIPNFFVNAYYQPNSIVFEDESSLTVSQILSDLGAVTFNLDSGFNDYWNMNGDPLVVKVGAGIAPSDLKVTSDSQGGLKLWIMQDVVDPATGEVSRVANSSLDFPSWFATQWGITPDKTIKFEDGTTWHTADVEAALVNEVNTDGSGINYLRATDAHPVVVGFTGQGENWIWANNGAVITGGAGVNTIYTGYGNVETFKFGVNNPEQTTLYLYNSTIDKQEIIEVVSGYTPIDLKLNLVPDEWYAANISLKLSLNSGLSWMKVDGQYNAWNDTSVGIDQIVFEDGTIWDKAAIDAQFAGVLNADGVTIGKSSQDLLGSGVNQTVLVAADLSADAVLNGETKGSTIAGKSGSDIMLGGNGDDTLVEAGNAYDPDTNTVKNSVFDAGAGNDTVFGSGIIAGGKGNDKVSLQGGVSTVMYNKNDGQDTVDGYTDNNQSTLALGGGIDVNDVSLTLTEDGNGIIVKTGVDANGVDQTITINNGRNAPLFDKIQIDESQSSQFDANATDGVHNKTTVQIALTGAMSYLTAMADATGSGQVTSGRPVLSFNTDVQAFLESVDPSKALGQDFSKVYSADGTLRTMDVAIVKQELSNPSLNTQPQQLMSYDPLNNLNNLGLVRSTHNQYVLPAV